MCRLLRMRRVSYRVSLFALCILVILQAAAATFEPQSLQGLYRFIAGPTSCSDLLRFKKSGTSIRGQDIEQDNEQCVNAVLNLQPNPSDKQGLIQYLRKFSGLAGTIYSGRLTAKLICPQQPNLPKSTIFVFFTPLRSFDVVWTDVLGANTPVETSTGVSVQQFLKDKTYIMINNRCVYRREPDEDKSACFPRTARVHTPSGEMTIDKLVVGDVVRASTGWTEIVAWTHREDTSYWSGYVTVHAQRANGSSVALTLTRGHMMYVDGNIMKAGDVQVGNSVWLGDGEKAAVVCMERLVSARGLYNPQTHSGDIVVDDIVVTTYTAAVDTRTAHALLAPVRAVARCAGGAAVMGRVVESMAEWARAVGVVDWGLPWLNAVDISRLV